MGTTYPEHIDNYLALQDGLDTVRAAHANDRSDAITAIQTCIGAFGVPQGRAVSLVSLLSVRHAGWCVSAQNASEIMVSPGAGIITDAQGEIAQPRRSLQEVILNASHLDIGSFSANAFYYIYAVADGFSATPGFVISASKIAPDGSLYYRKLGWFYNKTKDKLDILGSCIGNIRGLGENPNAVDVIGTTDISVTSLEYVDMQDMRVMFVSEGRPVEILFSAPMFKSDGETKAALIIDGTQVIQNMCSHHDGATGHESSVFPLVLLYRKRLPAGEHIVQIQWCCNGGESCQRGATDGERILMVREL